MLDGRDLTAKEGETFLLVTVDPEGWPHVALLSVGELLAVSAREIRLATWHGSGTTANLEATGRGLLAAVIGGVAYDVRLAFRRETDIRTETSALAHFSAEVLEAATDTVSYAELTSGVRFRLRESERVLASWASTIEALRDAARGTPQKTP